MNYADCFINIFKIQQMMIKLHFDFVLAYVRFGKAFQFVWFN